ncbi:uncharacterized protein LOC121381123 [Gigantopelta aegis]|uniref:uncharacterized protein LOC121381123 n=1 Tax=Gigantopelta aegis TaxID=1735272 RepID=UPI001B8894C6|nr:uncharacterized protein LOC121381123 [Gigantopelta aegis]
MSNNYISCVKKTGCASTVPEMEVLKAGLRADLHLGILCDLSAANRVTASVLAMILAVVPLSSNTSKAKSPDCFKRGNPHCHAVNSNFELKKGLNNSTASTT